MTTRIVSPPPSRAAWADRARKVGTVASPSETRVLVASDDFRKVRRLLDMSRSHPIQWVGSGELIFGGREQQRHGLAPCGIAGGAGRGQGADSVAEPGVEGVLHEQVDQQGDRRRLVPGF